jgi:ADP-heptose:LPS heptosyltransferase
MKKHSKQYRFLVWRNGSLGNTIVAIPFIINLRELFPYAHIAVVLEDLGAELLEYYPQIDEIIRYNKRGEHRSVIANLKFIWRLRKAKFTHSFHLKRFFRNGLLSFLAGIPVRIGFMVTGKRYLLNATYPYPENQNIVRTNLSLLNYFSVAKPTVADYCFYSSDEDKLMAKDFLQRNGLKEKAYVVIHCGGRTVGKSGAPSSVFHTLAAYFHFQMGLVPVFIRVPGDETDVDAVVAGLNKQVPFRVYDICNIRVNGEVIRRAKFFIGNNSGQAHLAALVS